LVKEERSSKWSLVARGIVGETGTVGVCSGMELLAASLVVEQYLLAMWE
jgi:hypothetical protein